MQRWTRPDAAGPSVPDLQGRPAPARLLASDNPAMQMPDELARMAGPLLDMLTRAGVAVTVSVAEPAGDRIVFANQGFTALTGFSAEAAVGHGRDFLLAAGADASALARLDAMVGRNGSGMADILGQRRGGTPFRNRMSVTVIRDADGAEAFRVTTHTDVAGADEATQALAAPAPAALSQEVQERLRRTQVSAAASGAWEWDIPAKTLVADERFASLYGLDTAAVAAGLPGSTFFVPIHEEDRMRMRIAVAGALQGAEVFARDFRVVVNGEVRWVSARGRTYLDADERPQRFTGVLTDISEQRKVEERLYVAQTAGGVGSFEYLCGYGTADVSGEFCRLLGLRAAQTLPVRTINSVVHPDDPAIIRNRDGQAEAGPAFHECRIKRADDGEERWLACRGEYRRGVNGAVIFVGVIYDITTIKQSEAQLRLLTEKLEEHVERRTQERDRVWNLSRDLLTMIGPDGLQKAVNPAWTALLGFEQAALVATPMEALVHPEDATALRHHHSALRQGDSAADIDIRLRGRDGAYRWVNWTAVLAEETIYGIGRDVTQRKLLEEQLRQSQKMEAVGQLTGGLAHDFNNMLTGILGGIDMARRRISQGRLGDVDRYLNAAVTSGQRAAALTHRLLAFSRRQTLNSRPLDVAALVRSMEDLLRRALGESIRSVIDLAEDLWLAVADESQLESAVLNLAINARDAMPDGGQLTITARNLHLTAADLSASDHADSGDFVEIRVDDTGVGMPPEILSRVFDPFFTTKPVGQGTGLGLSMIYGFARQSRGHVWLASTPGEGTSVRLCLPRHVGDVDQGDHAAPDEATLGTGETVLVVEDDPSVRLLVLQVLEELGYQAVETADGKEALTVLQSPRRLDLLVTDVGLPGLNGRQIAEIARQGRPDLPVLFMTGYAKEASEQGSFLDKGMELIKKPFSVNDFGRRIGLILKR